ncbi:MAG: hypothetical protein ACOCXA_07425 [Planctomycetota bacterium]
MAEASRESDSDLLIRPDALEEGLQAREQSSGSSDGVRHESWSMELQPLTDPAISAETDTHRSDASDALSRPRPVSTGVARAQTVTFRAVGHGTTPAPQAAPVRQPSARDRRRSSGSEALYPVGEGSSYEPPRRQRTPEPSTGAMHAAQPRQEPLRPLGARRGRGRPLRRQPQMVPRYRWMLWSAPVMGLLALLALVLLAG